MLEYLIWNKFFFSGVVDSFLKYFLFKNILK